MKRPKLWVDEGCSNTRSLSREHSDEIPSYPPAGLRIHGEFSDGTTEEPVSGPLATAHPPRLTFMRANVVPSDRDACAVHSPSESFPLDHELVQRHLPICDPWFVGDEDDGEAMAIQQAKRIQTARRCRGHGHVTVGGRAVKDRFDGINENGSHFWLIKVLTHAW